MAGEHRGPLQVGEWKAGEARRPEDAGKPPRRRPRDPQHGKGGEGE